MRKNLLLLSGLFFLSIYNSHAQTKEVVLNIGDSLILSKCPGEASFTHIDLMIKTRWPNPDATFDSVSGAGFYNWFFDGDIDSKRLPCSYQGMKFRIASVHQYPNDDGTTRTVVFGQLIDRSTVLWIEIQPAIESGEVIP